jgi:hypothetical protein
LRAATVAGDVEGNSNCGNLPIVVRSGREVTSWNALANGTA